MAATFETVDAYIASFPPGARTFLQDVRSTIRDAVPGSGETIRYAMPCVTLGDRWVVHYGGWKHHVGLYPVAVAPDPDLEAEIAPLRTAKDTVRLVYAEPVPRDLLTRIVQMLVQVREG